MPYAFAVAGVPLVGGSTVRTIAKDGGKAGLDNPFLDPITPTVGIDGIAELDYDVSRTENILTISGMSEYSINGFLELSVLNLTGLSLTEQQQLASDIFLNYGSVEKALGVGFISSSQVLFRERESMLPLNGAFTRTIDVDSLLDNDIVVTSLAHAISVPEPLTLLGASTALGFGTYFKRKLSEKPKKQKVKA